nr:MAG TPA: hypothetical protein [Bacteriophage sp.]
MKGEYSLKEPSRIRRRRLVCANTPSASLSRASLHQPVAATRSGGLILTQ